MHRRTTKINPRRTRDKRTDNRVGALQETWSMSKTLGGRQGVWFRYKTLLGVGADSVSAQFGLVSGETRKGTRNTKTAEKLTGNSRVG